MNHKGFTLVEVLASLVIISIVLTSFMALFINTNRIAANNNEKLLVINLADSYLEQIKIDPSAFLKKPGIFFTSKNAVTFPPSENNQLFFKSKDVNNQILTQEINICTKKSSIPKEDTPKNTIFLYFQSEKINTKDYKIEIQLFQSADESSLALLNVVVTVSS